MIGIIMRYLPNLIIISLIAAVAWLLFYEIYQFGRKIERLEWVEKEQIRQTESDRRLHERESELKNAQEQNERQAAKIIGEYANEIEKLHADLVSATDQRMYISAKTASCNSVGLPAAGKNEDPRGTGETVNAELSEPSATAIRGDYYAAANLELRYNMLTEIIRKSNCFEVIE